MALTKSTAAALKAMLADSSGKIYKEISEKIETPSSLSKSARTVLEIALADKKAATEVAAAIASNTALSKRAREALRIALASDKASKEVIKKLES